MRPGTYLLAIVPHCVRDAAKALTVKTRNKNDSRYLEALSIQLKPVHRKGRKGRKEYLILLRRLQFQEPGPLVLTLDYYL